MSSSREKVAAFRNKWLPEVGYDFQMEMVKMLDQHAAEARAEQRKACADKAVAHAIICGLNNDSVEWFRQAMLNAVGKEDESMKPIRAVYREVDGHLVPSSIIKENEQ